MINKPQDFVIILAVFGMVMITFGFGVQSVIYYQNSSIDNSYFTSISGYYNDTGAYKRTSDEFGFGLTGSNTTQKDDEANILKQGFYSLLSLGELWDLAKQSLNDGLVNNLGLDPIYLAIISGTVLMLLALALYTWLRA